MLFGTVPNIQAQTVQEWNEAINLSMSGGASKPSMVVDATGVLHAIWTDEFDGYKYSQSVDGKIWSTPITVKYPFSPEAPPPVLFSDAAGIIHIFFLDDQNKLTYAQTSPDNLDTPTAWRAKVIFDGPVYDFDAGVDTQGRVHVVYLKNPAPTPGPAGVFYGRSSNGGRTWAAPTLLYESPYFRSLTAENAHIRMAVSEKTEEDNVYVVWDERPQKRISIVTSADGGSTWDSVKEMVVPQENLGFRTPYNADIDVLDDKVLATWFVGEAGVSCTPYSWTSTDGGKSWGEQLPILPELARCPEKSEFVEVDPNYSVQMFTIQGDLSISAWNGVDWSDPEVQIGPSSIINPATFDPVLLGCERVASFDHRLLVVGCDESGGGDIWFTERQIDSLDYLFPLPSEWSGDTNIISVPRSLSSLSSVVDGRNNAHAVWIQSPFSPTDAFVPVIQYSLWNGSEWARPSPIFPDLDGTPLSLALQIDNRQRLLLSWVDPNTGELLFSWANSDRAGIPVEWSQPVILTASSKLTSSPDILVDATDRILLAYAITLNEGRGIYLIQSNDLGETWSPPAKVFDAIAESWEMVDQPKLALTQDGTLHILFTQYALSGEVQPLGLYYSQSVDGGMTWTPAELVSEQPVQWSELIAYQGTLHRLWQEQNKLVARTSHQVSSDGGKLWKTATKIPSDADLDSEPAVSLDGAGNLHFIQVSGEDGQTFEEWEWVQDRWQLFESRKVADLKLNTPPVVDSGITSSGQIYALLLFDQVMEDGIKTDLWGIDRSLELEDYLPPPVASLSTPSSLSTPGAAPELLPTPTSEATLVDMNDPQPLINRNIVGLILVIVVVLLVVVLIVPRTNKTTDKTKKS